MESFKKPGNRLVDWSISAALAVVSAVLYFCSLASYAFPGESARLTAVWSGLDTATFEAYPFMAWIVGLVGVGNGVSAVCGVVAVVCLYNLVTFFVRERIGGEMVEKYSDTAGRIAGLTASVVFMLTPAVREAATHLEPRMFATAWALFAATVLIGMVRTNGFLFWSAAVVLGVMLGFGLADFPAMLLLLPFYLIAAAIVRRKKSSRGYILVPSVVLLTGIVVFFVFTPRMTGDFTEYLRHSWAVMKSYWRIDGWLLVFSFATLPFFASLLSSFKAYNKENKLSEWIFHLAMSVASILAVATPLSPSALMSRFAILPVLTSAFAAAVTGYLASYWWMLIKAQIRENESVDAKNIARFGRPIALTALPVLAVVWLSASLVALFTFSRDRGVFADRCAEKIVADMGGRHWLVTDGTLDNHILLAARRAEADVRLICLQRDLDEAYLSRVADVIRAHGVGGERNGELLVSLSLGVLPFVQDWFSADPEAPKDVAIFGAPDLWYSSGARCVPEFLFFGADSARQPNWDVWPEFDEILSVPKGWGSYRLGRTRNPVERMRLNLRRHIGLVANNRGVYLQDTGDNDSAWKMYERVLNEIDADNICALFNEFEMVRLGHAGAKGRKNEIERRLNAVVKDADRRYRLWSLGNYYGYIRSPEVFIRLGFTWARSGRAGDALSHIRRAIDLVPTDRRSTMMNMVAALYASENDRVKSRETYQSVLAGDRNNHEALIGMMRLELLDGNSDAALKYLERAAALGDGDARQDMERAMLALMKGELPEASRQLRKLTDANAGNLQAWSLLAAVLMQQCDATKDKKEKDEFTKELEERVLPTMEKQARGPFDYYVQTTRAFVLMRKGEKRRKEARDALVAASKARPDIAATQDLVLGLDISLNDTVHAERQAREVLRRNRKAPLANYVMGSLELQKGDFTQAEAFLRKAVAGPKPIAIALNDLAEVLRRTKNYDEAERYARKAIEANEKLYVAYETLGSVLLDRKGDLDEAEKVIAKACDLSKENGHEIDVRMLISLARVQLAKGDKARARATVRKVQGRVDELSGYEKSEFEDLVNSAR